MDENFEALCKRIRRHLLAMSFRAQSSHIGSALSCVEALVALYFVEMKIDPKNPQWKERDRLVFSKAHASSALYAVLSERGFFPQALLETYYLDGGALPGHLDSAVVLGVETCGGSLGHGLGLAVGFALGDRLDGNPNRSFVVLSDGECNEGSIWEAVMLAAHHKLSALTVLVDFNSIQSFGRTNEVIDQSNLGERFQAFGWDAENVPGHSIPEIVAALKRPSSKPKALILETIKGKGISFMEDKLLWHYRSPTKEEYEKALGELL